MRQFNDGAGEGTGQGSRPRPAPRAAIRALLGLGIVGMVCVAGAWAGTRDGTREVVTSGTPRLVVEVDEIDLGDLAKGSSGVASFQLRNDGDANLRILNAETGCACAVADYDRVIPPGGVGRIQATLQTDTLNGVVAKGITFETNDPDRPVGRLTLRATVVTAIRVLPETPIVLRNYGEPVGVRRLLRRSANSGHGFFNISGLRANEPWIRVRAQKVREDRPATEDLPEARVGDWTLEIGLQGQPPYGRGSRQVEFNTGLDRQPKIRLVVLTEIARPVEMAIDRLFLSAVDGASEGTLPFTVRQGLDPGDLSVEAQPDGLSVELQPGEGRSFTAHVRWTGGRLEGGKLIFRVAGEEFALQVLLPTSG